MLACHYRGFARLQEAEQKEHRAHEQDMDHVSNVVHSEYADQPRDQQNERKLQQHLAPEPQPTSRDDRPAAEKWVRDA